VARLAEHHWDPTGAPVLSWEGGADRPLAVLLHGIGSSSTTWWRVGPALAERGWRVAAVDLRGHGHSSSPDGDGPAAPVGFHDLAADVLETVGRPIDLLVGHSLGALVAMTLVAAEPDAVRRLVLEDPPCQEAVDWPVLAEELERDARRARTEPDALRADLLGPPDNLPPGDADAKVESLRMLDLEQALAELLRETVFDVAAMARAVPVPTLLFLGKEDLGSMLIGPARAAAATSLPRGWTEVLACGHSVHREAYDSYMRRLDAWLEREGAGTPA
jgi:pimeloyl-ACP methyl ester carboxylesterase